jgi:hypothetical protein
MTLPLSRNTTYVPGSTPTIKAGDLNALQDFLAGLYTNTYSIAGAVIGGLGGVLLGAREATRALLRTQATDGTARSLTDYLGFRTGPVIEIVDPLFAWISTVGAKSGFAQPTPLGWQLTSTANTATARYSMTPYATWPMGGALALTLNSSRTATDFCRADSAYFYNTYDNGSPSSIGNTNVTVVEWAFAFGNVLTSMDYWMGFTTYASGGDPITSASTFRAGLRFAPGDKADTQLMLVTGDGTADNAVSTGITPSANTIYRCRLEIHRSGTPFGAVCRLFVNGASTTSTMRLPIFTAAPVPCWWTNYAASRAAVPTAAQLELSHMKAFALPFGSLPAGALTSDV